MKNIFIINKSVVFRTQLTKILEDSKQFTILGTANNISIAEKKLKILKESPNIILSDIKLLSLAIDKNIKIIDSQNINIKDNTNILNIINKDTKNIIHKKNIIKKDTSKIIAIGLSTGGLDVLKRFIPKLPSTKIPPILIVQHSSRDLSTTFIPKLIEKSDINIKVAKDNEIIKENTIYFPPFNNHLLIKKVEKNSYKIVITSNNLNTFHKPSIDILFKSIAKEVKENSISFILTGMGNDGVKGISDIKKSGGKTFAQNELSSTVFGMPKNAIKLGVIDKIIDIDDIAREIILSY